MQKNRWSARLFCEASASVKRPCPSPAGMAFPIPALFCVYNRRMGALFSVSVRDHGLARRVIGRNFPLAIAFDRRTR